MFIGYLNWKNFLVQGNVRAIEKVAIFLKAAGLGVPIGTLRAQRVKEKNIFFFKLIVLHL